MLRNTSTALLLGVMIALAETVARSELRAGVVGLALLVLASLSLLEGQRRSVWAQMHTYECAVWMPDVDAWVTPADER